MKVRLLVVEDTLFGILRLCSNVDIVSMRNSKFTLVFSLLLACFALVSITSSASAATLFPRTALLHEINRVRALHGVAPVYPALQLQAAANHHSDDMMARDYFSHTSPTGSSVYSRIVGSGFVNGYTWVGGETLAWGTGHLTTALGTVNAWLASPEHRSIMLSPTYRWVGISRACGSYEGHAGACVWTADWVKRS
jgi:uncharacterized protein YkwD